MGEPDWRRIKEVFNQVADLSEDQRGPLLDAACGTDVELRGHVEALLGSHSKAGEFMGAPTLSGGGQTSQTESPGDRIGPYTLVSIIGEGGFGVVYAAEQSEPLHRRVALKVIKLGMDTRQVLARFEQERKALSVMDHPSIARVLDAGLTARGQPYFVMELIEGLSITRYCDANLLSPRERLELFIPVCQAVQHAHQKGIIHRDLKPSNVLVAIQDGKPVPKIIDFGIAKATAQGLNEHTAITDFPPNSHPYGHSYEQWSARWWQWGLAQPVVGHPFVDSPDFRVWRGQSGDVWFLGAAISAPAVRTCTIPVGKALFVGIVNSEWSSLEGYATEADQRSNAVFFGDHIRDVSCTVDGRNVRDIDDFRFQSPQFSFTAPTPWIFGDTGGTGTSVADGYYVFLEPLRAGHHVLHFAGAFHFSVAEGDPFDLDAAVDMTYNLTVAP